MYACRRAVTAPTRCSGIGSVLDVALSAERVRQLRSRLWARPHCFGPVVRNKEGFGYLFTSDMFQSGVLTNYAQAFATDTSLASAEAQVRRWLPPDAKMSAVTIDHTGGSCVLYTITSPTLAKLFAARPKIQDPAGEISVEMGVHRLEPKHGL